MKHLGIAALALVAIVACNHKKEEAPAKGSAATGSAETGSAMAGSAETGSAMAGSAMAGSAMAGSDAGSAAMGSAAMGSAAMGSAAGSDAFNWEAMSHEARMDYMKHTVVPTMKPLFQKFDAKHFAEFGCKTCHGKDPKKSKFKMPTPDLPKLDFAALKAGKQKPEIAKWMGEVVEPTMADLLHKPKYNPAAPDPSQFGCLGCHEQKK